MQAGCGLQRVLRQVLDASLLVEVALRPLLEHLEEVVRLHGFRDYQGCVELKKKRRQDHVKIKPFLSAGGGAPPRRQGAQGPSGTPKRRPKPAGAYPDEQVAQGANGTKRDTGGRQSTGYRMAPAGQAAREPA